MDMPVEKVVDGRSLTEFWNRAFRAVAVEPRRQIVASLSEAPSRRELSLPEVANPVFDRRDPEVLSVEFVHEHLSLLDGDEFVEWRREPLGVSRGDSFGEVAVVLESVIDCAASVPAHMTEGSPRLEPRSECGG